MRLRHFKFIAAIVLLVLSNAASSAAQVSALSVKQRLSVDSKTLKKYSLQRLGKRGVGAGLNFYTPEDEEQMGADAAEEIESGAKLLQAADVTAYVQRVGSAVVEHSECKGKKFTFKVLVSDEVNALALPNGSVYVNTGLIMAADNEAELASVLAHEIAHVAARHASKAATRQGIWGAATLSLALVGGGIGSSVQPSAGVAQQLYMLKFGREKEKEADLLGLQYHYLAGYDPNAFVTFLERLSRQSSSKGSRFSKLLETHPPTSERIERAQAVIASMLPERESYIEDTSDFVEARAKVEQMTVPAKDREKGTPVLRHSERNSFESGQEDAAGLRAN